MTAPAAVLAQPDVQPLLEKVRSSNPNADLELLRRAYLRADQAHTGQLRDSGAPYIEHPLQVATILAGLGSDVPTIAAGLLHDVVEDTSIDLETIQSEFGDEVAALVDGVTKLSKTELDRRALAEAVSEAAGDSAPASPKTRERAANIRKLLLAMASDVRVMIIKLADRLHNMQTLDGLPEEKRRRVSEETQQIFAPLAHRLGIWHIKSQLEDLAFKHTHPEDYRQIASALARTKRERDEDVEEVRQMLNEELAEFGLKAEIQGRAKHLFSIWTKLQEQKLKLDEMYDLIAVRVIVNTKAECYQVLGLVHAVWLPIPGLFSDHIAHPKPNGYQSLHTKVIGPRGEPVEIQIRTLEMHRTADFGVAAHWNYKEAKLAAAPEVRDGGKTERADKVERRFEEKLTWLRQQLFDWQSETASDTVFLRSVVETLFADQVFVFTPRGDVIDLCAGSCPIDFAFRIHSEVGLHCEGAKVNGRMVPLSYQFKNGDIVEIRTRPSAHPSADWLNLAKSSHARSRIRAWLRKQRHTEHLARGRELLEKEVARLSLDPKEVLRADHLAALSRELNYHHEEDMLAAIGHGFLAPSSVLNKLHRPEPQRPVVVERPKEPARLKVTADGLDDLMLRRAACCAPVPGEEVVGYISRGRGLIIHRAGCPSIRRALQAEPDRIQRLEWPSDPETRHAVPLRLESVDRPGLLMDVTQIFGERKINVEKVNIRTRPGGSALWELVVDVRDVEELAEVMRQVRSLPDILDVGRMHTSSALARSSAPVRKRSRTKRPSERPS